ncbi:MAG: FISUMP domain-containing protein [Ignavibacteria bacterium]|nr:FISUMP domain-containing protein [Ignavibacteria bacterium]
MKKLFLILLLFSQIHYSQNPCADTPTVNYSGKIYNTVQIGPQCWLKENLEVGTMIFGKENPSNNNTIEKYYFNNDSINNKSYGGYYQWDEAMQYKNTPGAQGICPPGWHIPTLKEFQALADFVQNNGNSLKVLGSGTGAGVGTNTSGFSALLSGYRGNDGNFSFLNSFVRFWSSDTFSSFEASIMQLYNNVGNIGFGGGDKEFGYCIRCIKNNPASAIDNEVSKVIPTKFSLNQNYPNPFNPETTISYSIPVETRHSASGGSSLQNVTLKVYDVLGREVVTLFDEYKQPGNYKTTFSVDALRATSLPSGVYFYRLHAGSFIQTKKMLLLK